MLGKLITLRKYEKSEPYTKDIKRGLGTSAMTFVEYKLLEYTYNRLDHSLYGKKLIATAEVEYTGTELQQRTRAVAILRDKIRKGDTYARPKLKTILK